MKPSVVVDVGNSFIKWGRCANDQVTEKVYLPADDPDLWQKQSDAWNLLEPTTFSVAGVQPTRRDSLIKWLRTNGHPVLLIERSHQLPLQIQVEHPDRVGIDRLLDAVAANVLRRPGIGAVVIDAGSAVTVDWVDHAGVFCGGSIFPGLRLMAESLHDYTALLPLIQVHEPSPLPGRSTIAAMEAGIFWAVAGGIRTIVEGLARRSFDEPPDPDIFLTGGDATKLESPLRDILSPRLASHVRVVPFLTLEGIRVASEAQT